MTEHCLWRFSRALHRALDERRIDDLTEVIDPQVDWRLYGPIDMFSFLGARSGRDEVLSVIQAIAGTFEIRRLQRESLLLTDDAAATLLRYAVSLRANAKPVSFRVAHFVKFRDGRLTSLRGVMDTFDLVEQTIERPIDLPRIA